MKKVSKVSSKYQFSESEAKLLLAESGMDHIIRMSAKDMITSMPIEDLKKLFKVERYETHIAESVFEYEIVVSIEIPE